MVLARGRASKNERTESLAGLDAENGHAHTMQATVKILRVLPGERGSASEHYGPTLLKGPRPFNTDRAQDMAQPLDVRNRASVRKEHPYLEPRNSGRSRRSHGSRFFSYARSTA